MKRTISFTNSVYKYEHGTSPRGIGHWAFQFRGKDDVLTKKNCPFEHYQDGNFVIVWATGVMTLTEAKKQMKEWFGANGFSGVLAVAS